VGEQAGTAPKRGRPPSGAEQAIVAAALELIENEGLSRLTTKEVARRAGVSEASVFYHFGDKVGLLRAVVLAGLEPIARFEPSALAADAEEPLDRTLADIARAFESFFDQALPITEAIQGDPELRKAFREGLVRRDLGPHRGVAFLVELLDAMRRSGRIAGDADERAVAVLLMGASFLRAWSAHLGAELCDRLPGPESIGSVLARVLAPPPSAPSARTGSKER